MTHGQAHDGLTQVMVDLGMRAVIGFLTQHIDLRTCVIGQSQLRKQRSGALQHCFAGPSGLGNGLIAHDAEVGHAPVTVNKGCADFVKRRGGLSACTADCNAVLGRITHLLHRDLCEIAHHIGQGVMSRVADFIQHLF